MPTEKELVKTEVKCTFNDCDNKTIMYWPVGRTVRKIRCTKCAKRDKKSVFRKKLSEQIRKKSRE